jgi:FO synthase
MTIDALMEDVLAGRRIDSDRATLLCDADDLESLTVTAATLRDRGHGDIVSYSRKVFIPLTHLCRDVCHYCTFAVSPKRGEQAYLTPDQVLDIAHRGAAAGCKEALFTLGDKPELRWKEAQDALAAMGFATTIDYLAHAADLVRRETGLLPHFNPGVLSASDMSRLRSVGISMGLMLETSAGRLGEKGGPHYGSPDKEPASRLACIEGAGRFGIPFTSGLLIGIGETRAERIAALLTLRDVHERYGHLQEIIVQNFLPKPATRMAKSPAAGHDEHRWTIAVSRILFGPTMNIQAPPNLSPDVHVDLIDAGINDWGGVSPVTIDHVNPEAPWPQIESLTASTAAAGKTLVERLAIYPVWALRPEKWVDDALKPQLLRMRDASGFAREDNWLTGLGAWAPPIRTTRTAKGVSASVAALLDKAGEGVGFTDDEIVTLFEARGDDVRAVCDAADAIRREVNGKRVHYVVNRNINYTNVCVYTCKFCAFSKGRGHKALRGVAYDLDMTEFARRVSEAWTRGATEVCLQGGIHPDYNGETYLQILSVAKAAAPNIHVHAFSPLEIWQGAATIGLPLRAYLSQLKEAGLASLPGTAAEILDDSIRAILCPDKLTTAQWFEVMDAAHAVGLRSTATIMFGHIDLPRNWATHLNRIRAHQKRTGGFTEFVPLPFVAHEAPIFLKGLARRGPTFREALLMHAIGRLALHPVVPHIQTSWVKMGRQGARICLESGADDLGGTLMNESITRAAGAAHGQEFAPAAIEAYIGAMGREACQRTTLYGTPPRQQIDASFDAEALVEIVNTPLRRKSRTPQPSAV